MNDLYLYERKLWQEGKTKIAGVDEAGRGPMAGPLVAAAVVLNPDKKIPGLNDSKKLSPKKRQFLYDEIIKEALAVKVCFISVEEVDRLNVYQASKIAMQKAIASIDFELDYVLSDALALDIGLPCLSIIKGDNKSASIAAASIVAKVERDRYMSKLELSFPLYSFAHHKGYVTKKHLEEIRKYGITPHHRLTYSPVKQILKQTL